MGEPSLGQEHELPLRQAADLKQHDADRAWLVEGLWAASGAGLLGAEPKCCKTWLGLDMAISVATGTPCLRRFAVPEPGPTLYFAAEDSEHMVRARVAAIAATIGTRIEDIPLSFLSVPQLRLDTEEGRDLLRRCADHLKPKLLVVDPFVRVTQADENSTSGVREVLQFLRLLQREFDTAVLLVHHMKKGGGNMRPGQALRGSGDLHAFGDSNLFLARADGRILLTAEHRGAEGFENLEVELRVDEDAIALHALDFVSDDEVGEVSRPARRRSSGASPRRAGGGRKRRDVPSEVRALLASAPAPLSQRDIREELGCRMVAVNEALRSLEAEGCVVRTPAGYMRPGIDKLGAEG